MDSRDPIELVMGLEAMRELRKTCWIWEECLQRAALRRPFGGNWRWSALGLVVRGRVLTLRSSRG